MSKIAENVQEDVSNKTVETPTEEPLNVPETGLENPSNAQSVLDEVLAGQKELNELDDDQRDLLIYDFNQKNAGIAELLPERADEEYMNQCKKDFEDYQAEYLNITYEISGPDKALEYAKWLKLWNEDYAPLPANYWVGNLKFDEVITGIIETLEKNPEDNLTFDYGALTYTHNLMMQPFGFGIKYARWMADNQENYNAILNKLCEHVELVDCIKKKIGMLQSRWALACSGFRMNMLITDLKDFKDIDLSNM